jgi:hypothetical protein
MTSGGARNRSGPQPSPTSGRSDRRGLSLTALPNEGYRGEVPGWPLMGQSDREVELWAWAWTTPQASAWALEPWRWHSVAMWVRIAVICEGPMAQAADKSGLHRYADQIGLTPAGLKENGWSIAAAEITPAEGPAEPVKKSSRGRMRVVKSDGV